MNAEQWKSVLTTMVPVIGGILVSMNLLPQSVVDFLTGHIAELVGAVAFVAGLAYKIWTNTTNSLVTKTANLPEVTSIKVNTSELAGASTPENVTR